MIIPTVLSSGPFLLSPCFSTYGRLNPLLFSKRRSCLPPYFFRRRPFVAVAPAENGVFTSPDIAKSFDFASEERIYNWWESKGYFRPNFERGSDPFVISMPPPNVTGSLHMGHAMFVTLEMASFSTLPAPSGTIFPITSREWGGYGVFSRNQTQIKAWYGY